MRKPNSNPMHLIPGVEKALLVRVAARLLPDPARRRFIAGGARLGAPTLLTGCDVVDSASAESLLVRISQFTDRVQAALFNPNRLAPTFAASDITRPFPFNAFYRQDQAPVVDGDDYRLELAGLIDDKTPWTLAQLH